MTEKTRSKNVSGLRACKITVTVPCELYAHMDKLRDRMNFSGICSKALQREVNKLLKIPDASTKITLEDFQRICPHNIKEPTLEDPLNYQCLICNKILYHETHKME